MARKKDTPQKAALREMMGNYLKDSVNSFSQNQDLAVWQPVVNRL